VAQHVRGQGQHGGDNDIITKKCKTMVQDHEGT
jgi:hypothetical protein